MTRLSTFQNAHGNTSKESRAFQRLLNLAILLLLLNQPYGSRYSGIRPCLNRPPIDADGLCARLRGWLAGFDTIPIKRIYIRVAMTHDGHSQGFQTMICYKKTISMC